VHNLNKNLDVGVQFGSVRQWWRRAVCFVSKASEVVAMSKNNRPAVASRTFLDLDSSKLW
jgi:hypothetical protein